MTLVRTGVKTGIVLKNFTKKIVNNQANNSITLIFPS